jgi:pilus assembly protein Flp/PilA
MSKYLVAFLRDDAGLTMVEYAVAGTLITLTAVTAFTNLGSAVASRISEIASVVGTAGH